MKSAIIIATSLAAMAVAGPIHEKRAVKTIIDWVDVTVTVDFPQPTHKVWGNGPKSHRPKPSTTSTPEPTTTPPPAPTPEPTTSTPPPAPAQPTILIAQPVPSEDPAPSQAAAAPVVQAPAQAGSDYQSVGLYHHNVHRANHSAPAVTWSDELAGYAQNTGNTCVFKHDMTQGSGKYGQNLAMVAGTGDEASLGANKVLAQAISDMWYSELAAFNQFGVASPDMSNFEAWGHFSQLVWKGSSQIGCASVLCKGDSATPMVQGMDAWYTVCNYRSAGNVGGQYAANVGAPLSQAAVVARK